MNIFFLSYDIKKNVRYYCDKHVVKIILEIVQMLYNAHPADVDAPLTKSGRKGYKHTHVNHPMSLWVRETKKNYLYTCNLVLELCKEYTFRYEKIHSCEEHAKWLKKNIPQFFEVKWKPETVRLPFLNLTDVPICITNKDFHRKDVIRSYRKYYIEEKAGFAKWKKRDIPYWFKV